MSEYTLNDFTIGDKIYHLSNTKIIMVAIEINNELNEISCRWVDKNGNTQRKEFMPEELGKGDDLGIKISSFTLE